MTAPPRAWKAATRRVAPANTSNQPTIALTVTAAMRGAAIAITPNMINSIDTAIAQPLVFFRSPTVEVLISFASASLLPTALGEGMIRNRDNRDKVNFAVSADCEEARTQ
jgi:glucose-6-phosphate-specific signal transduction histidine kinase